MKTLLALLLTLALILPAFAQDSGCDPETDPTCHQMCPRDGECPCTWEPGCDELPPDKPHVKPHKPHHHGQVVTSTPTIRTPHFNFHELIFIGSPKPAE